MHPIHAAVGQVYTKSVQSFHGAAHCPLQSHMQSILCEKGNQEFFLLLLYSTQDETGHEIVSQPVTG